MLQRAHPRLTTILCVRKGSTVTLMGDGMVSQGTMIVKPNAVKLRRLTPDVIAGFAGSTADCLTLMERLETKLEEHPKQLLRACVELAKLWRTDRYLRHLEAVLVVADRSITLEVTGNGDVLELKDGVTAVGSGGAFARAAALALMDSDKTSKEICQKSMEIAASMCVHTNDNFTVEELVAE
jgi:ATP-dependent HslUV protease, peptidase subunit HslV